MLKAGQQGEVYLRTYTGFRNVELVRDFIESISVKWSGQNLRYYVTAQHLKPVLGFLLKKKNSLGHMGVSVS